MLRFAPFLLLAALATLTLAGCGSPSQQAAAVVQAAPAPPASGTGTGTGSSSSTPATIPGVVFTMTNDPAANAVLVFTRQTAGALTLAATVPTGGRGAGGALENQGALALNEDRSLLFVVNPGSNDFTVFHVSGAALTVAARVSSGGQFPLSISVARGIVYVLNDGSRSSSIDQVNGFRVASDGTVQPIANAARPLSTASTSAAQVVVGPNADLALVTERGTGVIDVLPLDATGAPSASVAALSAGTIPFGFLFGDATHVYVSEEGANAVSSYTVTAAGLRTLTPSARNFQSATCWLASTPNGQFLYTTNTTAGTISAFQVGPTGAVSLIGGGVAARASGAPIDEIVSLDGQYLEVVDVGGTIDTFRIAADGSITLLQSVPSAASSANGIVAA